MKRSYIRLNKSAQLLTTYERFVRKDGMLGRVIRVINYFTPLNKCDICGIVSTPKNVNIKNDVYMWNDVSAHSNHLGRCKRAWIDGDQPDSRDLLCMRCWNVARGLKNKTLDYHEIKHLIRKLQNGIDQQKKQINKNNRAVTPVSR